MEILVTGATGNVGRHVATQLRDAGVTVRALSRDPSSVRLPAGVTAVAGDLISPDSLRHAAAGADTAFLLWPFPTAQGAGAAVDAIAGQVRRIVYLSAMSVDDGVPPGENGVWGQVEQAIRGSAAQWTFLRAGGFAANTPAPGRAPRGPRAAGAPGPPRPAAGPSKQRRAACPSRAAKSARRATAEGKVTQGNRVCTPGPA
jgi:uncharacterized protein YbjT (DUF2867 family)